MTRAIVRWRSPSSQEVGEGESRRPPSVAEQTIKMVRSGRALLQDNGDTVPHTKTASVGALRAMPLLRATIFS